MMREHACAREPETDALGVFLLAGEGIESSTYAIEELNLTPKTYNSRLRELVDVGSVSKTGNAYRQTPFARAL